MARLDRLPSIREVAQLGAVLGREFAYEMVQAIGSIEETTLQEGLVELVDAELIYQRGRPPRAKYIFKHALIQDAAYQSLLKRTRQYYHRRVAELIEARFPETVQAQPDLVAHHYTEAGLAEKAADYRQRAGKRAIERSANLEAIAHLNKGLDLVKSLPETPDRARQELSLHITRGPALMATKGYSAPEVEQAYLRARELCREVKEPTQVFTVTWGLWLYYQQAGQLETAQGLADEVLALAAGQDDPAFQLQAHHAAWSTLYRLGELSACRDHTEQGIPLYDIDEHRSHAFLYGGHDPGVCGRCHGAFALWSLGYADQALGKAQDAVALAEELSHPFSLTLAQLYLALIHQFRQEADLAQERAEASIALSAEQGFAQIAAQGAIMRGWAVAARRQTEMGIAEMRDGLMSSHYMGAGARRSYFLALLAEAYGHTDQAEEGLSVLAESLDLVQKTGERTWEAEVHRLKGELLLVQSAKNTAEAETCFSRAMEVARRQRAKSPEVRAATSLARLWWEQGKTDEARELLAPVYGWFTEGFETSDLMEAKALLDKLE